MRSTHLCQNNMSSLKTNLSYSIAYQILNIILPLITAPYIARTLGLSGVGIYSYSFAVMSNFQIFAMLGITNHGSRSIAFATDAVEKCKHFWGIYFIQWVTHILVGLAYLTYSYSQLCINAKLSIILGIGLLSGVLDISWFFFGMEEFRLTVVRNFFMKIATTVLIFVFVDGAEDLYLYATIMALGTLASQSYLWFYVPKFIKWSMPSLSLVIRNIKPVLILFIPIVSFSVYKILSKILLGAMSSMEEVGLFENASKLLNVPLGFISAIGAVMMPRVSSLLKEKNAQKVEELMGLSLKMNTLVMSCLAFGLISTSDPVVIILFGDDFYGSSPILSILSISLFFVAWASVIRTQWLIPNNKNRIYVISTIGGAIVSIVSNLLLIPLMGGMGAAVSSVLAESSIFIFYMFSLKKQGSCGAALTKSIPYIAFGSIMFAIVYFYIKSVDGLFSEWGVLSTSVLLGIVTYATPAVLYMKYRDCPMYRLILKSIKR